MGNTKLDGAGAAKMRSLEEALTQLQRIHGLVEHMALAQKQQKPTTMFGMQIRRAAGPLVGQLKVQFGMVADQVAALVLAATRGGNEQMKVRVLREGVGQLRTSIDAMMNKVKEQHSVPIEMSSD
ncbi:MAG TPA: hypothetical protein VMM18_02625 [Gemmatimonadaceae bacterium]|nr:hypothetical protein [Gemmatimonadaceae bacterium]